MQGVETPPTILLQPFNPWYVLLLRGSTILIHDPTTHQQALDSLAPSKEKCPPCFNCILPAFTCAQYGECDPYNGQCNCPPGWGGIDCLTPQCDSLADGSERHLREEGKECQCKDGWGGINCNGLSASTFVLCCPLTPRQFAKPTMPVHTSPSVAT
ncbi:hypothetical protein F5148DRAFT_133277 [Russula earlei]|uniref:Uncharacterized protein n=1 Tax=Russula earlei TaxID=71964 RepID=A0ACC0U6V7_9AGAM|nr:hypothetical protein F5148DRAFT_133277 [Russula earlei]